MKEKEKELVQRKEKEEEECETVRRWMTNLLSGRERKVGGGSVPVLSTPEGKKKKKECVCVCVCVQCGFSQTGGLFIYFDSTSIIYLDN